MIDPPRASTVSGTCPPFYFDGFSPAAKDVAAAEADVFLTWPDTVDSVAATVSEMTSLAANRYDRRLIYGLRAHVIVRESESEARVAADRLVSRLDDDIGIFHEVLVDLHPLVGLEVEGHALLAAVDVIVEE